MKIYIVPNREKIKKLRGEDGGRPSHIFAKHCICDYLSRRPEKTEITYAYNEYGKPFIADILTEEGLKIDIPIFFSLSHSGNMLMCAVASANVGADCQQHTLDDERARRISDRFYTREERLFLASADSADDYLRLFFAIWARKEAYIKFTGRGISEGLTSFSSVLGDEFAETVGEARYYTQMREFEGYSLAVCIQRDNQNKTEVKIYD